jgi:glycosyltransferase involved in cell wall biosynthesis
MRPAPPVNEIVSKRVGRNVFNTPPKVSVIIPAYNSSEFICDAIDSVVAQKFREHEIIVINDGSPDTPAFESAIRTRLEEITYIRQHNMGAGPARNTGIQHARGDVIAFLDSDDVWMPDYLARQFIYLRRHELDMVYTDAVLSGINSAYRRTFMETAPSDGEVTFESLLDLRCNVITSGTLVRKQMLYDAGLFEVERVRAHDFHLWLRIAHKGGKIGYQRLPLLKYRVRMDSLSGDSVSRIEREIDAFERVKRTLELNTEQTSIVETRIKGLTADLGVEIGKTHLMKENFREAAMAFSAANRHRRSAKLLGVTMMSRLAPRTLLRYYKTHRSPDIALLPR